MRGGDRRSMAKIDVVLNGIRLADDYIVELEREGYDCTILRQSLHLAHLAALRLATENRLHERLLTVEALADNEAAGLSSSKLLACRGGGGHLATASGLRGLRRARAP